MSISYVLYENNLTSDPNDYIARVRPVGAIDLNGVIERMMQRGSTITKADALAVLQEYHLAIETLLLEGFTVQTPSANYGVSIKGTFDGQTDSFDASRHHVEGTLNVGRELRRMLREKAQVQKQESAKPHPTPLQYSDLNSGERNSILTAGGMGQIVGHRLKFDATNPQLGIFFIASDGTASRVDVVGRNKPAELMFLVPTSLTSGDYTLEVRALFGSEIRRGILSTSLTVA